MSEKELQSIQETLAHQEQQINDLSDMVIQQGKEITSLRQYIKRLEGKVEDLEQGKEGEGEAQSGIEFAAANKPPHY